MSISFFYYPLQNYAADAANIPMGMLQQARTYQQASSSTTEDSAVALHPSDSLRVRFQSMDEAHAGQQLRSVWSETPTAPRGKRPHAASWMRYLVELYTLHPAKDMSVRAPPNDIQYDQLRYFDQSRYEYFDWPRMVQRMLNMYIPYTEVAQPHGHAYMLHVPRSSDRYVVVGDIHGGLHTFVRLLLRWHQLRIVDLESFAVLPPYRLLFLGDILDRGRHSIEIFLTLLLMRYVNRESGRFYQCRGNHEHPDMFASTDEMATHMQLGSKFTPEWATTNADTSLSRWESEVMVPALGSLPTAISFVVGSQRYVACHGCVPYAWTQSSQARWSPSDAYTILSAQEAHEFMWNDVSSASDSFVTTNRGGPRSLDVTLETSDCNTLGRDDLERFAEMHQVAYVLRGHQDSCGHAILLTPFTNMSYRAAHTEVQHMTELPSSFWRSTDSEAGFVAQVYPGARRESTDVAPVLTLSTNTDNKRPLRADSFALVSPIESIEEANKKIIDPESVSIRPFLLQHLKSTSSSTS